MQNNGEEVVDRGPLGMRSVSMASLDCLPNDILVKILSLLPTKQAASTSVLSKRWRTLFASRDNIDFDDSIFSHPEVGKRDRDDTQKSFRSFVDRTLALQGGVPIKKFSLKCGDKHDEVHVDRWINKALEHNVSELHLRITNVMKGLFPLNLFTSKTIVKLTLGTELSIINIPSDTSLPVLKILILDSIWFERHELSDALLAGCPALEELTIHHKYYGGMPVFIDSKTVKKLSIKYRSVEDVRLFSFFSLETPNLVHLFYSDHARHWYPDFYLDSLVKATLDLHFLEHQDCDDEFDPNVTNLINGIRNVKILQLTSCAVAVISECCKGGLPVFKNLLGLVFSGNKERGWKVLLPLLLENSPNLRTLVLSGLDRCTYEHQYDRIRVPPSNKVNMLRIMCYQGSENELKHISHFLLTMECLEVVKVCFAPTIDDAKKYQLAEDLFKLPTASFKLKMQLM